MKSIFVLYCAAIVFGFFNVLPARAQTHESANYDESKVPEYKLPDPLEMANGEKVTNSKTWFEKRRPEILKLFESNLYGRSPGSPEKIKFELTSIDKKAFDAKPNLEKLQQLLAKSRDLRFLTLAAKLHILSDNVSGFADSLPGALRCAWAAGRGLSHNLVAGWFDSPRRPRDAQARSGPRRW